MLLVASDPYYSALCVEIAAEDTRNDAIGELFAANDTTARASRGTLLAKGVALGQVDASLELSQTASWLIALPEGGVGRAALNPEFDVTAKHQTLCIIIKPFLRSA